jgi:hypothetical protein
MIYEERDYRIKLGEFVKLHGACGLLLQKEHLGSFVALWGFESLADRMVRRKAPLQ